MTKNPETVSEEQFAAKASIMESYSITALVVPDHKGQPIVVTINLYDILKR